MRKNSKLALEEEARALLNITDNDIDTASIPEVLDFSKEGRGRFYRPAKKPVTLRLDAVKPFAEMRKKRLQPGKSLPFSLTPNEETIAAMQELDEGRGKRFQSADDLFSELKI